MDWTRITNILPVEFVGIVTGATVVLTAALIGIYSLVSGDATGVDERIQYYVLATAIAFLIGLVRLDDKRLDGVTILIATIGIAIASGILFALAAEGVRFGALNPDEIADSRTIVYFLSAGIVCTGLGMWGLRHWREFTAYDGESGFEGEPVHDGEPPDTVDEQ